MNNNAARTVAIPIAAALLLTAAAYGASLRNVFANIDDGLLITENRNVREFSAEAFRRIATSYDPELYIPLTILSYKFDYLLGGFHPFPYHLHNLLLHALNTALVFGCIRLLTRNLWIAASTAILFSVHPLHAEAVAWASARKDLLSAFFFLGSLLSYFRYLQKRDVMVSLSNHERGFRAFPWLSLILFFLGLLAKATILPLPAVLILTDIHQGRRLDRRAVSEKIPYVLLSVLFGVIALGGKAARIEAVPPFELLLLAPKSILLSLTKILFPLNLSVFYPQLTSIRIGSPDILLPLLALPLLGFAFWHARRWSRFVPFGAAFFLLMLAPSFPTVSRGGNIYVTSDRYAYLASVGIFLALAALLMRFATGGGARAQRRQFAVAMGGALAVAAVLTILTMRQALLWGDGIALFTRSARLSLGFYLPYITLGALERHRGNSDGAIAAYTRAITLHPLGNTYGLLGQVYGEQGDTDRALAEFAKGLALAPEDPELHHGLGQILAMRGDKEGALRAFERAIAADPAHAPSHHKIGVLLGEQNDIEDPEHSRGRKGAIAHYRQALAINPFLTETRFNLAVELAVLGKIEEAILEYERILEEDETHAKAQVNLALLEHRRGRTLEAIHLLQAVLQRDPGNEIARAALRALSAR